MFIRQSSTTVSMSPKFVFGFLFFLTCLLCAWGKNPNVIIILADDLGYGDCEPFNPASKISTPNLNQLANEGIRFTDALFLPMTLAMGTANLSTLPLGSARQT